MMLYKLSAKQRTYSTYSAEFQSMFRMDMMAFEQLLDMVAPQIAKENTVMRMSISP